MMKKFHKTGSLLDKNRNRQKSVLTLGILQDIRTAITRSSHKFLRCCIQVSRTCYIQVLYCCIQVSLYRWQYLLYSGVILYTGVTIQVSRTCYIQVLYCIQVSLYSGVIYCVRAYLYVIVALSSTLTRYFHERCNIVIL